MSVFIIADAGSNARPSLRTAFRLAEAAKRAGADAFKLQLWHADHLYPRQTQEHREATRWQFPDRWIPILHANCNDLGIEFMCSTFCLDALDLVDPHVRRHKVAGIEAHDVDLVKAVLAKRKPVILTRSLGLPTRKLAFYRVGAFLAGIRLTVLQGLTAYPAPLLGYGLWRHPRGRWGISDHTTDPILLPVAAAALGASVIEKHLRLSGQQATPDAAHSLDPKQFALMVRAVRQTESALWVRGTDAESPYRRLLRKDGLRGT